MTKQAGEYLVAAELCRQGLIATTFSGNVPIYDIIASDDAGNHVLVQVKTIKPSSSWQFDIQHFVAVTVADRKQLVGALTPPPVPDPICIFVCLGDTGHDRFFIFRWSQLQEIVVSNYRRWLDEHGGGRPKKVDSFHCAVRPNQLVEFENRWDTVKVTLKSDV